MQDRRSGTTAEPEVPEHIRSWWIDLLEGEEEGSHPLFGNILQAQLKDQTLVVSGALPSEAARRNLERELHLIVEKRGVAVRNDTTVAPEGAERPAILEQTLIAIFEQELHAKLAIEQVEGNPLLRSVCLRLLAADSANRIGEEDAVAREHIAATYQGELRRAIAAGHAILIATADETDAFALRELLDEDTRSLQVLVMPPILAAPETRETTTVKGTAQ